MASKTLTVNDLKFMLRAISVAERARQWAPPNPWVGCVLVKDRKVIAEGWTQEFGGKHAEVVALEKAGAAAKGATAYVTLEPCAHHGRTGPCCEALQKSGVKRVVIALEDPDPQVSGAGIQRLRNADIEVTVGIGAASAEDQLRPYLHQRRTGMAYPLLKTASSIDGRVAAADGRSQWISGTAAREDAHRLRAASQAILVGAGTALVDQPRLNVRLPDVTPSKAPLRVLLDGSGRVPTTGPLFDPGIAPTLVLSSDACAPEARQAWEAAGAEVAVVERKGDGLDLRQVLQELGRRGVLQVMVEGGAAVHGSFLREDLAEELVVYIGPKLLGENGRA